MFFFFSFWQSAITPGLLQSNMAEGAILDGTFQLSVPLQFSAPHKQGIFTSSIGNL